MKEKYIQPRQVWSAEFPYEDDGTRSKSRPVLVLRVDRATSTVTVMSMMITSTPPRDKYDFALADWADIPIDHQSTLRPSRIANLPIDNFGDYMGELSEADWDMAMTRLSDYLRDRSTQ